MTDLGSCCITTCVDPADNIGAATFQPHSDVGAVETTLTVDLPLCGYHLGLLRMPPDFLSLNTRDV